MCRLLSWTSTSDSSLIKLSAPPAGASPISSQKSQLSSWPPGASILERGEGRKEKEGDKKLTLLEILIYVKTVGKLFLDLIIISLPF